MFGVGWVEYRDVGRGSADGGSGQKRVLPSDMLTGRKEAAAAAREPDGWDPPERRSDARTGGGVGMGTRTIGRVYVRPAKRDGEESKTSKRAMRKAEEVHGRTEPVLRLPVSWLRREAEDEPM